MGEIVVDYHAGPGLRDVVDPAGNAVTDGKAVRIGYFPSNFDFRANLTNLNNFQAAWTQFAAASIKTIFAQPGRFGDTGTSTNSGFVGKRISLWILQTLDNSAPLPNLSNVFAMGIFTSSANNWSFPDSTATPPANQSLISSSEVTQALAGSFDGNHLRLALTRIPTAVRLAYVKGWLMNGRATVEWETVSEFNTVGFDLYRMDSEGHRVRVNAELIAARNSKIGGVYRQFDIGLKNPSDTHYELVETETSGKLNKYGPILLRIRSAASGSGVRLGDGTVEVRFQGDAGVGYDIEVTNDLQSGRWRPVGLVGTDANGLLIYREIRSEALRFYRALKHLED